MGGKAKVVTHVGSPLGVILNFAVNVFWTGVCVAPVCLFCARFVGGKWLYVFLGVSVLPYLVPRGVLRSLQVGDRSSTYRRLGVAFVNRFTQDGTLVRRLTMRGGMRRPDASMLARMERSTYTRERFHLAGFVFFVCLTVVAVGQRRMGWAACLVVSNVVYNVYPVLLQQYVRLRLKAVGRKAATGKLYA